MLKIIFIILGIIILIILFVGFYVFYASLIFVKTYKDGIEDMKEVFKMQKELKHKRALRMIEDEIVKQIIREIKKRRSL